MENKQEKDQHNSNNNALVKTELFGITITNEKKERILEYVVSSIEKSKDTYFIVTPNPEIVVYASKHPLFKKILNTAKVALPDGVGLLLGAQLLGKPLIERIAGVDFMEELCKYINKKPITVGFLGGRDGVAKATADCLIKKYPGLKVEFVGEEPEIISNFQFQISNKTKKQKNIPSRGGVAGRSGWVTELKTSSKTQAIKCDILFVAFGFPKQEEWMYENIQKLDVRVMMGVGGAFDYISGTVPRAPKVVQASGLEWLYRLAIQPWRWKRQVALFEFIYLVCKEKLRSH